MAVKQNYVLNTALRTAVLLDTNLDMVDFDAYHHVASFHKLSKRAHGYLIAIETYLRNRHPTYRTRDIRGLAVVASRMINDLKAIKATPDDEAIALDLEQRFVKDRMRLHIDFDVALHSRPIITLIVKRVLGY